MKYRPEIDGLRALAIIPVVLFHAGFSVFSGGFVGVDVFFVISGYLITLVILEDLEKNRFSLAHFYNRRARRILPALFVVMLATIPFAWQLMTTDEYESYAKSLIATVFFISNILFWKEDDYFGLDVDLKPLLHTWSLSIEEQYYLFFPLLAILFWKRNNPLFGIVLTLIFVSSLMLAEQLSRQAASFSFNMLPTRAWELMAGALVAYFEKNGRVPAKSRYSGALASIGFALVLVSVFFFDKNTRHPGTITLLPITGTVLIILFGRFQGLTRSLLAHRWVVGVGLISYSLYLWHQPIFAFAKLQSLELLNIHYIPLIALSTGLAYLSWKFVETPIRTNRLIGKKALLWLGLGTATFLVGVGLHGDISEGALYRYPDTVAEMIRNQDRSPIRYLKQNGKPCHDRSVKTACSIGDTDQPVTWALVGDSHAGTLGLSLDQHLQSKGLAGLHLGIYGCAYNPGFKKLYGDHGCARKNEARLQRLLKDDIQTIVMAGRYTTHLEGAYYKELVTHISQSYTPVGVTGLTESERKEAVAKGFASAIQTLLEAGKRVILIYPIPEVPWNVPRQYEKSQLRQLDLPTTTSAAEHQVINAGVYEIFDAIEHPNLVRFHPEQLFCNRQVSGKCITQLDGKFLYVDSNHLSIKGAEMLTGALMETLESRDWLK